MRKKTLAICLIGLTTIIFQTQAQLAITEIQTSESANSLPPGGKKGPDWWELSNLGTSNIDLTGYRWQDGTHSQVLADTPFAGVIIHPGESIILSESNTTISTPALFRQWWGANNVGANVQVVLSTSANGLSASGDAVRLWSPNATNSTDPYDPADLVDRVDVGAAGMAPNGGIPTFIYNTNNGAFNWFSTNGVGGAFIAATSAEVGSPGIHPNAAPIVITQQPTNVTVTVGQTATITVVGYGLPKPRFQWLFNGSPVNTNRVSVAFAISNNVSFSTLTITNAQGTNAGPYWAVVSNGVQASFVTSNAVLSVNGNPLEPYFTQTPSSLSAYLGQTVTFAVTAFGNPPPTYQWQLNGTNISGQTSPQIQITLSDTNQTGTYTVIATNSAGGTNASVSLLVTPKPDLRITEVMSSESTNNSTGDTSGHSDWWEISNFGSFPVNLQGYRFDDSHFSLADAYTITNNVTIQPGESIVLVENMTPTAFREWWGAPHLPPHLQIITYPRIGFSATSDGVTLWNPAAATESDYIDSEAIGTAVRGTSFGYDPNTSDADFGFLGYAPDGLSVAGVNGAFVAPVGGDTGSPGMVLTLPNISHVAETSGGFSLSWPNQPDWNYTVEYKTNLTDAAWQTLTNFTSDNASIVNVVDPATGAQRFYRVKVNLQNP